MVMAMLDKFFRDIMSGQPTTTGIKFGQGVLGKTGPIVGVGVFAMATLAFSIDNIWIKAGGVIAIGLLIAYYIQVSYRYAHAHPNHAIMEGGHLLKAMQIEQATNDKSIVIDETAQPISNPSLIGKSKGKSNG